jgi:hypothetical protein
LEDEERSLETRAARIAPGPGSGSEEELVQRVKEGDPAALGVLLRRHKDRLRRIVAVRLAVRLARVLEQEELPEEVVRAALGGLAPEASSEAEVVRWLARLVEREVRRRPEAALGETREPARTLRLDELGADHAQSEREDRERLLDARVAGLEPAELREVLLLRDYCGADWELVRAKLGLLSVESAQELYRRAHAQLARRLRPQVRRQA